jgi:hypothetical protein
MDRPIARYLEHGTLPPRKPHARWDKTCKRQPRPVPGTSSSAKLPASTFSLAMTQLGLRP